MPWYARIWTSVALGLGIALLVFLSIEVGATVMIVAACIALPALVLGLRIGRRLNR